MKKKNLLLLLCLSLFQMGFCESSFSWDFEECEIKDILFALSVDSGISISLDDTVKGTGSLKYSGNSFEKGFEAFLNENRLCVRKSDGCWVVSKFLLCEKENLFDLDVFDLTPAEIIEKISVEGFPLITFDSLPVQKISLHYRRVSCKALLEALSRRFGSYSVVYLENGVHFSKNKEKMNVLEEDCYADISFDENNFRIDVKNYFLNELLEKLFENQTLNNDVKEFCFIGNLDKKITRASFSECEFPSLLKKLCNQCDCDFTFVNKVFYVYESEKSRDNLLSKSWQSFSSDFCSGEELSAKLQRLTGISEIVTSQASNVILVRATEEEANQIKKYIDVLDVPVKKSVITLQYISPSFLYENLPPGIEKSKIKINEESNLVYFSGSEIEFEAFKSDLELIDVPAKNIRYDLLILQYDDSEKNSWLSSFTVGKLSAGDRNNIGVQLGNVMSFNLNVVSAFGLNFATKLQGSIQNNYTSVFADTVLYGVSGKTVSFENSSIYRYRDNNLDPDTGKPIYSGVTREIDSGIKLEIKSKVTGDNYITSVVTAKVSRQGLDTSSTTGNPPPTTEKIITTEVCGKSGEPIILSGLLQKAISLEEDKSPLLTKIPFVGSWFKNREKIKEHSQMVIYLVPHIEGLKSMAKEVIYDKSWQEKRLEELKKLEVCNGV